MRCISRSHSQLTMPSCPETCTPHQESAYSDRFHGSQTSTPEDAARNTFGRHCSHLRRSLTRLRATAHRATIRTCIRSTCTQGVRVWLEKEPSWHGVIMLPFPAESRGCRHDHTTRPTRAISALHIFLWHDTCISTSSCLRRALMHLLLRKCRQ